LIGIPIMIVHVSGREAMERLCHGNRRQLPV